MYIYKNTILLYCIDIHYSVSHDITCTSDLYEVSQQNCLGHSTNHGLNKTNSATLVNESTK